MSCAVCAGIGPDESRNLALLLAMPRPDLRECSTSAGCPPEIRAYLSWLAPTRVQQQAEVRHLLLHANTDHMSAEDRQICGQALAWLERRQ